MMRNLQKFLGVFCVFFAAMVLPAAEAGKTEYTVTADSMLSLMEKHQVELNGNVMLEDENMILTSQKMVVHLDEKNKLQYIEALDGVTVRKKGSLESASGDKGIYDAAKDEVTLRGNCVIVKDRSTLKSQTVVYDRKNGSIQAQRVSITLPAKGDGNGANPFSMFGEGKAEDARQKAADEKAKDETPGI